MVPSDRLVDFSRECDAARRGDRDALGRLTEMCRPYLLKIAAGELNPELRAKFAASDLVQDALLEGQLAFEQFVGATEEDLLSWLRRILRNNLIDEARKFLVSSVRNVKRELSLDGEFGTSLRQDLQGEQHSTLDDLMRMEKHALLDGCVSRLPDEFRLVIQLRHAAGMDFASIGQAIGKTAEAARKIWFRSLMRLRQDLQSHEEFGSSG